MAERNGARKRSKGSIDQLPSGSLRVRVYAGFDPLTGRRNYLTEIVKPGPRARAEAEKARTRLQHQVDEQNNPVTRATVNQLLDRYLEVVDVQPKTKQRYEGIIRMYLRPAIGSLPLAKVDGQLLDRFFAQLRRCRERCSGSGRHQRHRTTRPHECDERCAPTECKPLSTSSIRATHFILSAAFARAVRWRWLGRSPMEQTESPGAIHSNPMPPTPDEAARLLEEAWQDADWGAFVWTAMTTGARRGELCALKREDVDLDNGVLWIRCALKLDNGNWVRRGTKTHQQRRVALDSETVDVLREYIERVDALAAQIDCTIGPDGFLFTSAPDASTHLIPDSVTQRYDRMAKRLNITTTLHKLRHYSATELLAAGVDIRTVAGRLGHGGGGSTTLRVYAAWVSESDQRAAASLGARMKRPRIHDTANGQPGTRQDHRQVGK